MGTLAQVKRNDYGVPLIVNFTYYDTYLALTDSLELATPVVFNMTPIHDDTPTVDRAPAEVTDVDPDSGIVTVTYMWQPGDTDTVGTYRGEFEFDLFDGVVTGPTGGYITIRITDDLG